MNVEQFKNDLKRVLSLVAASQRFLEQGKVVELTALESKIADLCAEAKNLAVEDRSQIVPHLAALQNDLAELENSMRAEHGNLQRQLKGLSNNTQALNAYAQAARTR
ncbi:hypothetical protein [Thalassospira sp.]|uniref:hypothetical protein n=1 Tax=Thalassospira sp. TaxID=1912094 RepID=UPI002735D4E8|nr:hypothetical protein [Thalassospira sp.]MDP2696684.1 hypothetical protein [Thalassospira sp.]